MPGLIRREAFSSAQAFSFGDLEHHARALLAQAEAQAEALLAAARVRAEQEAERIKSDAHTTGLADGRRAGMEAVRRETQQTALKDIQTRSQDSLNALTVRIAAQRAAPVAQAQPSPSVLPTTGQANVLGVAPGIVALGVAFLLGGVGILGFARMRRSA